MAAVSHEDLIERALKHLPPHPWPPAVPPFEVWAVFRLTELVEAAERFPVHLGAAEYVVVTHVISRLIHGEVCERPPRRMPTTKTIARWHGLPDETCWRCGRAGEVERAHVVDHCYGGLDGPQNLGLLCCRCHRRMPPIDPDDWRFGLVYVFATFHSRRDYDMADYTTIDWCQPG